MYFCVTPRLLFARHDRMDLRAQRVARHAAKEIGGRMVPTRENAARITKGHLANRVAEDLRDLRHGLLGGPVHAQLESVDLGALPQLARQLCRLVELARQRDAHPALLEKPPFRPRVLMAFVVLLASASFSPEPISLAGRLLPRCLLPDCCVDCLTLFIRFLNWPLP